MKKKKKESDMPLIFSNNLFIIGTLSWYFAIILFNGRLFLSGLLSFVISYMLYGWIKQK